MREPQHPSVLVRNFERLFRLSQDEREHLERLVSKCERIEARRKLITAGAPCRHIFILCLAYERALHSTATLTRCEVAQFAPTGFERIQRDFPRLATALFLMTLRDGAVLHEWEVNLGRRAALPRIAHLLLELDRRLRMRGLDVRDGGDTVPLPLAQQDIADCTGLSLPYVNRTLQQMRDEGYIRLADRKLEICDRAGLAKAAGFAPDYVEKWGRGWMGRRLGET